MFGPGSLLDPVRDRLRPLKRHEYDRLVELGAFEGERIELLKGVLVEMTPQHAPHASTVQRLSKLLIQAAGDQAAVRIQLPLAVSDDSEPEPDLAVVPPGNYDDAHPRTALLVIEVADASLARDRGLKMDLYATANVQEYWIVDLVEHLVEVHTDPLHGRYSETRTYRPGDSLRVRALAALELRVEDVLPPRPRT